MKFLEDINIFDDGYCKEDECFHKFVKFTCSEYHKGRFFIKTTLLFIYPQYFEMSDLFSEVQSCVLSKKKIPE